MAPQISRFADVILYDLRGHGNTERVESGYAVPELVADQAALLDALGVVTPVLLVGHSFGGLLAQAFTATYSTRVRGIVLIDGLSPQQGWAEEMVHTLELQNEERDQRIAVSFQNWLGRHSRRKTTRLAVAAEALVYRTSLVEDLRSSPHLTDAELSTIRCPVLIVSGEHSDMRGRAEHLSSVLPNAVLRLFPQCTHSVLWEATADVCGLVVEWLRGAVDPPESREATGS
jgi:pimeloyl-ACP methyl ester carboxylesterase